jgi:hypothetical protein
VQKAQRLSTRMCLKNQECDQTPVIPTLMISDFVLPFVHDRRPWNSVCGVNKEMYEAGMRMTSVA